jgi:hypothetical protein
VTGIAKLGAPKLELSDRLSAQPLNADGLAPEVRKAIAMHNENIAASNSFHSLFCERYKAGQNPDDLYEQDLLRAMLIFSCSGLDATLKQLVRDGLERVIARDIGAQRQFAKYIERRLKRGTGDETDRGQLAPVNLDYTLLASFLASPDPRLESIRSLTVSLTSDSLQSRDQLLKVAAHFALTREDILAADEVTKEAFEARNQLAHEMDIDFRVEQRRRDRSYGDMVRWSENILQIGRTFITCVSSKIAQI